MVKRGLGRGLEALLPEVTEAPGEGEVEVSRIEPNPFQPRREFREAELAELAASIREHGILQPLVLRRAGAGYQLVAGERRWRAAKLLGLSRVPAVVRELDDRRMLELALIENLQRADLNPLEEAAAYRRLIDDFQLTQEAVAQAVGKSRPYVANALRLLTLEPEVRQLLARGELSAGHGKVLLGLPAGAGRRELATRAAARGLSVKETEEAVRRAGHRPAPRAAGDPEVRALAEALMRRLGAPTVIRMGRGRGTVEIAFSDLEDLDRLAAVILGDVPRGTSGGG